MRLQALSIRNWKCIGQLDLDELDHPIVVLYGPNRTGKTSLVDALRACLLDFLASSQHRDIRAARPWGSESAPEVVVCFRHGGGQYRISKRYGGGGREILEEFRNQQWYQLRSGQEASLQVRRMLGAESSSKGWYQLLWVPQGEIFLPQKTDRTLQSAVEGVLGSMVQKGDRAFYEAVRRQVDRWYPPRRGGFSRNSPVHQLEQQLQDAEKKLREVKEQLGQFERLQEQYENLREQEPLLLQELREAESQWKQCEERFREIQEKQHQHQLARTKLEAAQERLDQLGQRLRQIDQTAKSLEQLRPEKEALKESRGQCQGQIVQARQTLEQLQQQLRQAQQRREQAESRFHGELLARQQWVQVQKQYAELSATLHKAESLAQQLKELQHQLQSSAAPSQKELEDIETNRDQAQRLQAQLEAGQMLVKFSPEQDVTLAVELDGQAPQEQTAARGKTKQWRVLDQATVRVPGVGAFCVERAQPQHDLQQACEELERLQREFRQWLEEFKVPPETENPLAYLRNLHSERQALRQKRDSLERELRHLVPQGLEKLREELEETQRKRDALCQKWPELEQLPPEDHIVDHFRQQGQEELEEVKRELDKVQGQVSLLQQRLDRLNEEEQKLSQELNQVVVQIAKFETQQEQAGDRSELLREKEQAEKKVADLQQRVRETTLSEEEKQIERLCQQAQRSLENAQKRYNQTREQLVNLEGQLSAARGLHQRHIEAEERREDLLARKEREVQRAEAHLLLEQLYQQFRGERVRGTLAPISQRVLGWARYLGLDEYQGLAFNDSLIPNGLHYHHQHPQEKPQPLDVESLGTVEQLSTLVRLAIGQLLAQNEDQLVVLDDPLAHADRRKHQRMLDIFQQAVADVGQGGGRLQLLVLTCHPERFDSLEDARMIDLTQAITSFGQH